MIHVHVVQDVNISSAVEERRKLYVKADDVNKAGIKLTVL